MAPKGQHKVVCTFMVPKGQHKVACATGHGIQGPAQGGMHCGALHPRASMGQLHHGA